MRTFALLPLFASAALSARISTPGTWPTAVSEIVEEIKATMVPFMPPDNTNFGHTPALGARDTKEKKWHVAFHKDPGCKGKTVFEKGDNKDSNCTNIEGGDWKSVSVTGNDYWYIYFNNKKCGDEKGLPPQGHQFQDDWKHCASYDDIKSHWTDDRGIKNFNVHPKDSS